MLVTLLLLVIIIMLCNSQARTQTWKIVSLVILFLYNVIVIKMLVIFTLSFLAYVGKNALNIIGFLILLFALYVLCTI